VPQTGKEQRLKEWDLRGAERLHTPQPPCHRDLHLLSQNKHACYLFNPHSRHVLSLTLNIPPRGTYGETTNPNRSHGADEDMV
jgi:hypothetical protein